MQELESVLSRDVAQGRLALGALLGGERLRVYSDGRIEGSAILRPNKEPPEPIRFRGL
jgi:hypothetical protein